MMTARTAALKAVDRAALDHVRDARVAIAGGSAACAA
jgi:hypothetical protein